MKRYSLILILLTAFFFTFLPKAEAAVALDESFTSTTFPPTTCGTWTTGGSASWTRNTVTFNTTPASAVAPSILDDQSSWIDCNITLTLAGTLTFSWKVSSEYGYDFLLFCYDNDACTRTTLYDQRISGEVAWTTVTKAMTAGSHSLRWLYAKDVSLSAGSNTGWLDNVFITGIPTITTPSKTSFTTTTAVLGGNITSDGGAAVTGRGVCVATTADPILGGNCFNTTGTTGIFTVTANAGMSANTLYHYRAYATNSVGTSYTTDDTFYTLPNTPAITSVASPTQTTLAITWSAPTGGANSYNLVWCSGSNCSPSTVITGVTSVYTHNGPLTCGTLYSYILRALNVGGGVSADSTTVANTSTSACPSAPTVTTPTSASIGGTTATLGGNVTSAGTQAITARGICYSVTTTNSNPQIGGAGVTCTPEGGITTGVFTINVSNLTSNTGYSYNAYATNSVGTTYTLGTFTTLNIAPATVGVSAPTALNSYFATLNGSANPNGYATTGHFRVFANTTPGNCTSDTGGRQYPEIGGIPIGSGSTVANFSYTIPFNGSFLTPNTTYYYCSYAVNANGTTGASSVLSFFTPFGPANPCDAPITGTLSLPATASCSFSGTTADGVDAGSGTTNTANILLNSGVSLTINAGQTIARGGIAISGGTLTIGGGGLLRAGLYVHDADADGVLDDSAQYVGTAPPAGYVRRTAFKAVATNSAALAYASNINAITLFDCNPSNINVYQNVGNLVKDADNDGYKTAVAAAAQCVGVTSVINGRTYYKDTAGAYTWMDAASALGSGATDCDDTTGAPCAPTPGSVTTVNGTSVTVSWSATTGPAATSYTVTCVSGGACSNTSRGTQTSGFTDSSLTCGTTYTYNVVAVNAIGSSPSSSNFSGTTGSCSSAPTVTTSAASSITSTTALLNSTINPNGASTSITYRYQTGATSTCNASTPTSTIAGPTGLTGSSALSGATTQKSLTGLAANTTYYFCATANNAVGTTYDVVLSFTTLKANGTICTLASECNSGYCYVDADNDRYAPSSGTKTCRAASQLAGTDCYDSNANAFPGQTLYFTTNRGDLSFDYNCDSGETKQYAYNGLVDYGTTNVCTGADNSINVTLYGASVPNSGTCNGGSQIFSGLSCGDVSASVAGCGQRYTTGNNQTYWWHPDNGCFGTSYKLSASGQYMPCR